MRHALGELPAGSQRTQALVALRSLFPYLRSQHRIFRNPVARLHPGAAKTAAIVPLTPEDYQQAAAAATTPEHKLALVLAAVLAARPADMRRLQLDDIDLGERRITIAGKARHMNDLAYAVISDYLTHRRTRWPGTANPHVLISQQTTHDTRPVTPYYINQLFKGCTVTLDRVRSDRWLEEALNHGPDPLHLSAVFGISTKSAMRYAQAAKGILENQMIKNSSEWRI